MLSGNDVFYDFKKLKSFVVKCPYLQAREYIRNNPNILSIEEDHPRFLITTTTKEDSSDSTISKRSLRGLQAQTVPYGIDMVEARDILGCQP